MLHVIRLDRVYTDMNGSPVETVPRGFIVNDSSRLFPYLTNNAEEATPFATYQDTIDFVANHMSEFMAAKKTDNAEFSVTLFERDVVMNEV